MTSASRNTHHSCNSCALDQVWKLRKKCIFVLQLPHFVLSATKRPAEQDHTVLDTRSQNPSCRIVAVVKDQLQRTKGATISMVIMQKAPARVGWELQLTVALACLTERCRPSALEPCLIPLVICTVYELGFPSRPNSESCQDQ